MTTEQTATETAPVEESAQPQVEATPEQSSVESAWTPSYKYKFNGEERDIDEALRPAIKDPVTEQKIKDLVERAEALPNYKNKVSEWEKKYGEVESKYTKREQQLGKLAEAYQKGDYDRFFDLLGVDQKVILKQAAKNLSYAELPEEQRRIYDENRAARQREEQLREELGTYQERATNEAVLARTFQLDSELGKAEVKSAADVYDGIYGSGAFKNEVVKLGQFEALSSGRDLTAAEAVMQTLARVKPVVERIASPSREPAKPAVIPNIKGNSATPAKKGISSIADLKKMAAQGD